MNKNIEKWVLTFSLTGALVVSTVPMNPTFVEVVGSGTGSGGNETINSFILTTYSEMAACMEKQAAKHQNIEPEVIGESVRHQPG